MQPIDTHNLPANFQLLGTLPTLRIKNETLYLVSCEDILFHILKTPSTPFVVNNITYPTDEPGFRVKQLEFPITALHWIIETIEMGFWKEKCGIEQLNVLQRYSSARGEKLRLCFIANYGEDAVKGVSIENFTRPGRYLDWQDMGFSYRTLKQGRLLDFWRDIVGRYERGEFITEAG